MIIKCPECGKDISDKALSCPHCGCPINSSVKKDEEYLTCPKCGSRELHADQKGFSGGKALMGGIVAGPLGILAGTIGKSNVTLTCLKCGKRFKAGEAKIVHSTPKELSQEDEKIISIIKDNGAAAATKYYKDTYKTGMKEAFDYVQKLKSENNVHTTINNNSGCATMLIILIISSSLLMLI